MLKMCPAPGKAPEPVFLTSPFLCDSHTDASGKNYDDGEPEHGSSIHGAKHQI